MRPVRFFSVGAIGIVVQLAVLRLLHGGLGIPLTAATVLAIETAVLHNFAWHERWTWRDRPATLRERIARLLRFHLTNGLISLAGGLAITTVLSQALGVHYLLANGISIALCAAANYLASEYLVFRPAKSA